MNEFNVHVLNDGTQEWYHPEKIFDEIKLRSPDVVNFFALEEYAFFPRIWDRDHSLYQNFFFENNIRANFFLGVANLDNHPTYFNNPSKNCFVYLDPLFQFRLSFQKYSGNLYKTIHNDFQYNLMALLFQPRPHRCMFIDELAKRELITNNAVTWHQRLFYNQPGFYQFKYWNPCILKLASQSKGFNKVDQWNIPDEWQSSFLHVVSETLVDIIDISEKTCAPLLGAKLFISYAAKGFHRELEKLGFKLYDEVIDYSFDSVDDHNDRLCMLMDHVDILINTNHQTVYSKIQDKLKYNQQHAIKLALSKPNDALPQFAIDYYNRLYSIY